MATKNKKHAPAPKKRVRELPQHRSFRLTKRRPPSVRPLPKIRAVFAAAWRTLWQNKRLFGGVAALYALINFVVVQGLGSAFDIVETKLQFEELFGEETGVETSLALFGYLVGSGNSPVSEVAGTYQLFFFAITTLAVIWLTRQVLNGEKPQMRDGFYKGVYPLVPFSLVMIVIGIQLIPALIGNFLYATVVNQGLAVTAVETVLFVLIFILLLILSLYMITSSIFALYIVTLPDVRPLQALRSARQLVLHRRLGVLARVLALPLVIVLSLVVLFVPLIIVLPAIVEPLFIVVSALLLVYSTIYMYHLYKGLL